MYRRHCGKDRLNIWVNNPAELIGCTLQVSLSQVEAERDRVRMVAYTYAVMIISFEHIYWSLAMYSVRQL